MERKNILSLSLNRERSTVSQSGVHEAFGQTKGGTIESANNDLLTSREKPLSR